MTTAFNISPECSSGTISGAGLIDSKNATGGTEIVFTNLDNSYTNYVIVYKNVISNVFNVANGSNLLMQFSSDNGVTFDTANNYILRGRTLALTTGNFQAISTQSAIIAGNYVSAFNPRDGCGKVEIFNPSGTNFTRVQHYHGSRRTGNEHFYISGGQSHLVQAAVNAIKFTTPTGPTFTGEFYLYGIE